MAVTTKESNFAEKTEPPLILFVERVIYLLATRPAGNMTFLSRYDYNKSPKQTCGTLCSKCFIFSSIKFKFRYVFFFLYTLSLVFMFYCNKILLKVKLFVF